VDRLRQLVVIYGDKGRNGGTDWVTISAELNRAYDDCKKKWDKVRAKSMKNGPFTPDEVS
jgi:hypothetical protein